MARKPTKADLLRAQKLRLLKLRQQNHEATGATKKLTQWAEEYGIGYQTLKKAAAGERPLQTDDALAIARFHGVSVQWVLFGLEPDQAPDAPVLAAPDADIEDTVPLLGWVSAGSTVTRSPLHEAVLDQVKAPPGSNSKTRALEIRGDSLGALFDRWLVYFDDEQRPVSPDLLNRLCIVELSDGRVLVKKIKRAARQGAGYDLLSNTEKPIKGVQIKWAARVKLMEPR